MPYPRLPILALYFLVLSSTAAGAQVGEILWQPHVGEAFDGSPIEGELGRLVVPENRAKPGGAAIELAFVRYRTSHPDPGPPLVFLAGGPGASGLVYGAKIATHPQIRLLEQRDVIALDQRGTGLSRPNLMEPECAATLPSDRAIERDDALEAFERAARDCVDHWTEKGVDLAAYNSVESADDVETLRAALGEERLVLFGSSYGSHLALAYLRRHPERVERAILLKVEGPDHTWKLPSTVQARLEALGKAIAEDAEWGEVFPDFLGTLGELLFRLEERPVTVDLGGTRVAIGTHDLRVAVARALATAEGIARLPAMIHRLDRGEWRELAEIALENRRISVPAMPLAIDCASGGSAERLARIESERRDPENLLGDALMAPFYPEICRSVGLPELGEDFRQPFESGVPVFFVSGTLDARTPPENVEEILAGFSDAANIVVQGAGHGSRELMAGEYRNLLQAFLRGEEVTSSTISLPPVRFEKN